MILCIRIIFKFILGGLSKKRDSKIKIPALVSVSNLNRLETSLIFYKFFEFTLHRFTGNFVLEIEYLDRKYPY